MARYIDADKIDYTVTMVGRDENAGYRAVAFESDIDEIPTADVVPKRELDMSQHLLKHRISTVLSALFDNLFFAELVLDKLQEIRLAFPSVSFPILDITLRDFKVFCKFFLRHSCKGAEFFYSHCFAPFLPR